MVEDPQQPPQPEGPAASPGPEAPPQFRQPSAPQPPPMFQPPPAQQAPPQGPPPGYYQQPAYQQPVYQQPIYQQPPVYTPGGPVFYGQPPQPANGSAIGGFITSISAIGVLIFFAGFAAPLTLIASIVGTVISRKGVRDFDAGRAVRQRGLGQAGFILGIVGAVLAVLAIVLWVLFFIFADTTFSLDEGDELTAVATALR